jgi:diguanylate cyclase (GGDEF)-like protein
MLTLVMKNINGARSLLRSLPKCTCFPKINGFEAKDKMVNLVIGELEEHPDKISDEEFIELVKSIYNCVKYGIYFGPVTRGSIKVQDGKSVIIPNFNATPRVISGRIENPFSFFTTIRTLASAFKSSGGWPSKIHRESIPAIFQLMKILSLEVIDSKFFLPSLGVWRHDKFIERLKKAKGHIFVHMMDAENLIPFISNMGKIFSSIEEIEEEIYKEKEWHNVFSSKNELSNSDLTALAFLFPMNEKNTYIFNSSNSVEMHTFCNEIREFHPNVKIVEFLETYFDINTDNVIVPPTISPEELPWFLRTFFGMDVIFKGDVDSLFTSTKGEIFAISSLILNGQSQFVDDKWEVYPAPYTLPNAASLIRKARCLAITGEKPNLGLELIKTARNISQRKLEAFESLKAFFYKVLGKYEKMDLHFKNAEEFGRRAFRNAYYAVVLSMNGMDFSISQKKASPLIEIMKKYALMVSNSEDVSKFYDQIIFPLEKIRSYLARRIECMARNYIGLLLENEEKTEEAIDEFETALSLAQEYKFRDLQPLIKLNIANALSDKMIAKSNVKALQALKDSMNGGLRKNLSFSYLILALNSIEMGKFEKAKSFLSNALKANSFISPYSNTLEARMKVEDLNFESVELVEDEEEREFLEFLYALYTDDEDKVEEMLKSSKVPRIKNLSFFLQDDCLRGSECKKMDYLSAYFLSRRKSKKSMLTLKNLGKEVYTDNANIRKIFYEEQLSKAYRKNGLEKSADYHLNLAALIAKQIGLKRRAAYLASKIKSRVFVKKSYEFFSFCMSFRYFNTTYEIVRSLTTTASNLLKTDVICQLEGVENFALHATSNGIVWDTNEKPDPDFAWIFGKEMFVYLYHMENNTLYMSFKTKDVDIDEAILTLDHIIPIYATHIEKSVVSKVSNIDTLTKLYSRRYIMNKLAEEVERSQRYKESLSVAMLDIDDFKRVNDKNGHDVGDDVLKSIAEIVMDNVRSIDSVGRYGGEEFLIIFPHTPLEHALKSCERIRKKVEMARIIPSNLTVSIGLAQLKDDESVDKVVKKADIALYMAKSYGKNCVVPYFEKKVGEL